MKTISNNRFKFIFIYLLFLFGSLTSQVISIRTRPKFEPNKLINQQVIIKIADTVQGLEAEKSYDWKYSSNEYFLKYFREELERSLTKHTLLTPIFCNEECDSTLTDSVKFYITIYNLRIVTNGHITNLIGGYIANGGFNLRYTQRTYVVFDAALKRKNSKSYIWEVESIGASDPFMFNYVRPLEVGLQRSVNYFAKFLKNGRWSKIYVDRF